MDNVVPYLLAFIVIQQVFHLVALNKLINKVMSRDFHQYALSEKALKTKEVVTPVKIQEDEYQQELSTLNNMMGNITGIL